MTSRKKIGGKARKTPNKTNQLQELIGEEAYESACLAQEHGKAKKNLASIRLAEYKKAEDFKEFEVTLSSPKKTQEVSNKNINIILLALRRAEVDPDFKKYLIYENPDLFNKAKEGLPHEKEKEDLITLFASYNTSVFKSMIIAATKIQAKARRLAVKHKGNTLQDDKINPQTPTSSPTSRYNTPQMRHFFPEENHADKTGYANPLYNQKQKSIDDSKKSSPNKINSPSLWQKIKQSWHNTSLTAKIILIAVTAGFFTKKILMNLESCKIILAGAANYLKAGLATSYNLIATWWVSAVIPALKVFLALPAAPYIILGIYISAIALMVYCYYKHTQEKSLTEIDKGLSKSPSSENFSGELDTPDKKGSAPQPNTVKIHEHYPQETDMPIGENPLLVNKQTRDRGDSDISKKLEFGPDN